MCYSQLAEPGEEGMLTNDYIPTGAREQGKQHSLFSVMRKKMLVDKFATNSITMSLFEILRILCHSSERHGYTRKHGDQNGTDCEQ